jgi:hypothetical protein
MSFHSAGIHIILGAEKFCVKREMGVCHLFSSGIFSHLYGLPQCNLPIYRICHFGKKLTVFKRPDRHHRCFDIYPLSKKHF